MAATPDLSPSNHVAIFLDFDGTLVHIAERPELAHAPAHVLTTLERAYAMLDGALALITGRSIASLDELLDPLRLPAAGVHGIEYRDATGMVQSVGTAGFPAWATAEIDALATSHPGLLLEHKGHGVALHYREAPALEAVARAAMSKLSTRLGPDFVVQDGKMVVELRPACASKGTAVARFMAEAPFAGRRPVFVGDDITDEDAFRVVNDMGGYSIKVGDREPGSAACYELADVDAVRAWLLPLTRQSPDNH